MSSNYSKQIGWLKGVTHVAVGVGAVIGSSSAAQALTFNFTYAPGITQEQIVGFEMAGNLWSQYLTDNITLNMHVAMSGASELGTAVGAATPAIKNNQTYSTFLTQLGADRTSTNDQTAFNSLPNTMGFDMMLDNRIIRDNRSIKYRNLVRLWH